MNVNTKNRAELKAYFVKNGFPTEGNFADLIDGVLNQRDDGLCKLPDNPLCIAAADAEAKRVLELYRSFGEGIGPEWRLSLDPKIDPDDPAGARTPGLDIADGSGRSRLFLARDSGRVGLGTTTPEAALDVRGVIRADAVYSRTSNPMYHRMYPRDPLVYQDMGVAEEQGAIVKLGSPTYDRTSYATSLWHDRYIIKYGDNNEADGNGAKLTIPAGYDTAWIRVLGNRNTTVKAYFLDGAQESLGLWHGGHRDANCYCPDGSLSDGHHTTHQWLPIPAGRAGALALIAKPDTNLQFWISGVAFSRNPWAHATQSASAYFHAMNGGDPVDSHGALWHWNNDLCRRILKNTRWLLKVPVIPSGRDKLLYLIEHNNNWNGAMHTGITVNGTGIERFCATYDNPFARHWNSKWYNRYIAARIPAEMIPADARYLDVCIDMSLQDHHLHFRELGTHDLELPA